MRCLFYGFCVLSLTVIASNTTPASQNKQLKPNIILFFSDDQGTLDLNCYGSKDLHTPHLDKLAERGVRFTRFYVAAPVCSPSRAALLTGRYTYRCGVSGNVSSRPGGAGLPLEEVTIAEMLKQAGYATGLIGKWHLGTAKHSDPLAQGFDTFFGHKAGCIDNYSHFFYWSGPPYHDLWRDRKEIDEDGEYFTNMVVRESRNFIDKHKDEPFFLYVPFNIPHYPLQAPKQFRDRYKNLKEPRRAYAAMISVLDDAVGRILAKVQEHNLSENTIVIFLSDHGHSTEERCNFGGGNAGPYRGAKFSLLEGGLRVPCIMSWPGHLPKGQSRNQPCISIDIYPTIAELCRVNLPKRKIDGNSLVPVLQNSKAKAPHDVLHWQLGKSWAVRKGDWKLIVNGRDTSANNKQLPSPFLVDLSQDPGESRNLAKTNAAMVEDLTALHQAWAKQWKK